MTSIALGVFIIFIIYVMIWSIKNDGAKSIRDQTGLIRMRDPSNAAHKSAGRRGHRRHEAAAPVSAQTNRRH